MNNIEQLLQDLGKSSKKVGMTSLEKTKHKELLQQFMQKSADLPNLKNDPSKSKNPLRSLLHRINPAYIAVPFILVAGVGVVYAAQAALPGDLLYGLKTNVIEKVQTSLTFSAENRASLDAELAIRRLQEGEAVADKNSLNNDKINVLSKGFSEQQQQLMEDIDQLKSEQKVDVANKISADFSQKLADHQQILDMLTNHQTEQNSANPRSDKPNQNPLPVKNPSDQKTLLQNSDQNNLQVAPLQSLPTTDTKYRLDSSQQTSYGGTWNYQPQTSASSEVNIGINTKVGGGD